MKDKAIGVFDSGVGGLTVVRSIIDILPEEDIIYLGDDARGPYGPRELDEVRKFAREIIEFLLGFGVKVIVIACNTATAAAIEIVQSEYDIPIIGVIKPGVRAALRKTRTKRIGVIGTVGTINSGAYERVIGEIDPEVIVVSRACPEFVDFVERNETHGSRIEKIARSYLEPMVTQGIDTLVLGCTHYPLLEDLITDVVGPGISLISSAEETAVEVGEILDSLGWKRRPDNRSSLMFLTTGDVQKCRELGRMFLGPEVEDVIKVRVGEPALEIIEHFEQMKGRKA